MRDDIAVVVLAGGEATRFPGKLETRIGDEPLVLRAYRHACATGLPVYVAAKSTFAPEIDGRLQCPIVIDRWAARGPLGAVISACGQIPSARVGVLAADLPFVDETVLDRLLQAWQPGDEAVVAEHDGKIEPLAAIYARSAVLREGFTTLVQDRGKMHAFIDRIRTRRLPLPAQYFANVNTPADLRRALARGAVR